VHAPDTFPLLRTWLFGPGADAAAYEAMAASGAHVLIQGLEDFTPPARRHEARGLAAALFTRWRAAGARVCARINALDAEGLLRISRQSCVKGRMFLSM
jgi:citrate lyase subunit beta/citryl-CoA lyase